MLPFSTGGCSRFRPVFTYCYYADSCRTAPSTGGTGTDVYSTTRPPTHADPTGERTTTTYAPTGSIAQTVTPAVTTTYAYDGAGHVTSISYSTLHAGYASIHNVSETYNSTGTRASMSDGSGTTTYTYNDAGDLMGSSFTPASGTSLAASDVSYAYYPTGQQKSITYPSYGSVSNPKATYTYSSSGEMTSVEDWLGHTTTFFYGDNQDLKTTSYPNSTTSSGTFNTTGALTKISLAPATHLTAPLATIFYTRNATDQVTKEADTGDLSTTKSYIYDESGRLSSIGSHTTSYGTVTAPLTLPNGAAATYDSAGELTKSIMGSTTTTYTNDLIGDRTKASSSSSTSIYGYNALGELTSATVGGSAASFQYNSDGTRVGRTIGGTTQTYVWNTMTATPQLLSDGTTDIIYGANGQAVEQLATATTTPTYLVHDQIGSTRLLTDQAGTVVGTYTYDGYGNLTKYTGTGTALAKSPIGYAGGWETTADQLLYLVHRYYDPSTGQFLSVDPTVANTKQPYVYASNNPINRRDVNGKSATGCTGSTWFTETTGVCITLLEQQTLLTKSKFLMERLTPGAMSRKSLLMETSPSNRL